MINLLQGDCIEIIRELEDNSIDLVLTDLPYGTTSCKWDSIIPLEKMWEQLYRVTKKNSAILLFGAEPFSTTLRASNLKNYKYDWIWIKPNSTSPFKAKFMPMLRHEFIHVFANGKVPYHPQMEEGKPYKWNSVRSKGEANNIKQNKETPINNKGTRYPSGLLYFKQERGLHPTQKPVPLLEYLIRTHTKENDIVLDFTMGSGSTKIASINTNRSFIGIEKDIDYFNLAKERI